jgi:hypothetical protein
VIQVLILDTDWKLFNYRVVYFPTKELAQLMLGDLRANELVRIRQTSATLEGHPDLLRQSEFKSICIDLTEDLATLRKKLDSTCRRWLRKAEAMSEVEIRINDPATYSDFIDLYNRFAARSGHSGPISARSLAKYAEASDLLAVYHQGLMACGHLWLRDEVARRVRLVFSASARLESKRDADLSGALNRHLHWQEIEKYKSEGFELYDMGGFEADEDVSHPLTRFKLSLGAFILKENNYCFGRGLAKLIYRIYAGVPLLTSQLRGRLPA